METKPELFKFLPEVDLTDFKPFKNSKFILEVKRLRPEHALALQKALNKGTDHIAGYFAWAENAKSWNTKQALFWIQGQMNEDLPAESFAFFLGKDLVGMGSIRPHGHPREVQMAYWVSSGYLKQGIGESIARTLERVAFIHRPYQFIFIEHDSSNRASGAIPQKLNYAFKESFETPVTAKKETGLWLSWGKESDRYKGYETEREKDLRFIELTCLMFKEMHPNLYEEGYAEWHQQALAELAELRVRTKDLNGAA